MRGWLFLARWWPSERTFGRLREGQPVGAGHRRGHTPRISFKVQQRALTHAPLRAGQAPSRRRAAAGGGSGPRFLSLGLRASSHRSPGELRLATTAEPATFLALPRHPAPCSGGSHRGGVRAGSAPAAPPSGPSPGQRSLPPGQPLAAQPPGCGAQTSPADRDRTPGAAPGGRRDVPKPNLGGRVRKRNSAGAAPATLFPPPGLPPAPFPRLSSLPAWGCAAVPLPVWRSFLPLFSHPYTSLYRTPWGPLRPSPPPWPHGLSCRPLMPPAVRRPGPQCPQRGKCWVAPKEVGVRMPPRREEVARPASIATAAAPTPIPPTPQTGSNSPGNHCQNTIGKEPRGRYYPAPQETRLRSAESYLPTPQLPCGEQSGKWLDPGGREAVWAGLLGVCPFLFRASLKVP